MIVVFSLFWQYIKLAVYVPTFEFLTNRAYDPADYEHLPVNQEIKELFQYITRW